MGPPTPRTHHACRNGEDHDDETGKGTEPQEDNTGPAHDAKTKAKTQAMTGEEKEAAKAMFDKFDDNKNGVLEENEFKCALKAMNRKFGDTNNDPADDVCAAAFKKADQDSSGSVDLQEFEVA